MRKDFIQGVEFSHYLLNKHIDSGATVVDATCGNGHDTLFLARLVGDKGKVLAFDIQKEAIERTKNRLVQENLIKRVSLIHDDHKNLSSYLQNKKIEGVIFNLGYLPGGDKKIITRGENTLQALKASLKHLRHGGIIAMVIYTGHKGGPDEAKLLLDHTSNLNQHDYNVLHYHFLNQENRPPQVLAIKKRLK